MHVNMPYLDASLCLESGTLICRYIFDFKTQVEFAKRTAKLLKKVLVLYKSLDPALQKDCCIFRVYRCIFILIEFYFIFHLIVACLALSSRGHNHTNSPA